MRKNGFIIIGVCLCLVFVFSGCALFKDKAEKTAPELAEEGRAHFEDENYGKAIEAYKRLKDWYPYSQYAKEAELKIADAHYELEEYEEALFAYEQFEKLHPSDPKIAYVIYRMGRCYSDRMKDIDRTQVPTRKALDAFDRLQSRFPDSKYAEKADPLIKKCQKHLAGHEFYVGEFYFKADHYKAALARFQNVVNDYPPVGDYHKRAEQYIAKARKYIEQEKGDGGSGEKDLHPQVGPEKKPMPGQGQQQGRQPMPGP